MAEKKRQCGTCRFFVESEKSGGHGKCTHPKRDKALREMVLLRPNELGCRTRWGTSLWQDRADDRDPFAPETPQQPTLPDPIPAQLHYDDEVTSVSIAGSTTTRPSFEDDVVNTGAVAPGMGFWSDTLQEERRRLMRNGDHDAVAGARKRHIEKQAKQRELIPFAEDDLDATATAKQESPEDQPTESVNAKDTTFPPDDYVEEERSSESDTPINDDALVDDGTRPGGRRSTRVNKLMRETKSPKDPKAMGLGTPAEISVTSHNPEKREQWNSVPSMTPGFELPFSNNSAPKFSTSARVMATAAPMSMTPPPSRPVSQARELMSDERLRQERARRHVSVPMAVDSIQVRTEPEPREIVTNRPRLTEAPHQRAAPADRLKSSPLRGYHPAVKAAALRAQETGTPRSRPIQPTGQRPATSSQPERAPQPVAQRQQNNAAPDIRQKPIRQQRPQQPRTEERRPMAATPRVKDSTPFMRGAIRIAPQVPRCCGTCASFRPSDVEGRGSCINEFAGPGQRVVNEQNLGCKHTFGCFWLPADEKVWLNELIENRAATPRVDKMIAQRPRRTVVLPDLEELTS